MLHQSRTAAADTAAGATAHPGAVEARARAAAATSSTAHTHCRRAAVGAARHLQPPSNAASAAATVAAHWPAAAARPPPVLQGPTGRIHRRRHRTATAPSAHAHAGDAEAGAAAHAAAGAAAQQRHVLCHARAGPLRRRDLPELGAVRRRRHGRSVEPRRGVKLVVLWFAWCTAGCTAGRRGPGVGRRWRDVGEEAGEGARP